MFVSSNDSVFNSNDNVVLHESITTKPDDNSLGHTYSLNDNCIFNSIKHFYLENKKHCKIAHININSIRHKFEPFREILQHNIFDVLTIQETKIDDSFPDNQFNIPMYRL